MSTTGILYLLPVPIVDENPLAMVPESNLMLCRKLIHFIAEDEKSARRHLKIFGYQNITEAQIQVLNEHSRQSELSILLAPLIEGNDVALMSDAGCPGIADPGADLVRLAHTKGIRVVPLTGPSSIVLSIMASGFNGQNFAFNGYLPVERPMRIKKLRELELICQKSKQAQFFIETPYRNMQMFESMLEALAPSSLIFIGKDIGAPNQFLKSASVQEWRKNAAIQLHKVPVVFGIGAP